MSTILVNTQKQNIIQYFSNIEENYKKLKHGQIKPILEDIMRNFCCIINKNELAIDFKYFKFIAQADTYNMIIQYIINTIQVILQDNSNVNLLHINLKSMSLLDIEKHFTFIKNLSEATDFTNHIVQCNIYQSGFVFNKLLSAIFLCLDKDTRIRIKNKIKIIE